MKTNLRKLWTLAVLSLSCLTLTGTLQADSCMDPCDPCDQECCGSFFAGVDWLYWEASETGLSYARTFDVNSLVMENEPNPFSDVKSCSRTKNPNFTWGSGIRIFAGWRPADDCWDAAIRWTHFDHSSHGSYNNLDGTYAIPTWGASLNDVFFGQGFVVPQRQTLNAKWNLDLDLVDFELGREFDMCCCLAFRPHVGIRYAKINQKVKTKLFNFFEITPPLAQTFETRSDVSMTSNFKGTGIRGGFDTNWCFCDGFGIYGNTAASLLYGNFSVNQNDASETEEQADSRPRTLHVYDIKQSDKLRTLAPVTDFGIGAYYQSCCGCIDFTIKLGWEMHYFWGQNRLQSFDNKWFQELVYDDSVFQGSSGRFWDYYAKDNSSKGDLALQGLTLSFMADF